MTTPTILEFRGSYTSSCGYCKSPSGERTPNSKKSVGMLVENMHVQDYLDLIERGWRRCGNWLYLPTNSVTCCPQYTIRLNVNQFKSKKKQRQALRRFERFLHGELESPPSPPSLPNDDEKGDAAALLSDSIMKDATSSTPTTNRRANKQISPNFVSAVRAVVVASPLLAEKASEMGQSVDHLVGHLQISQTKNETFGHVFSNIALRIASLLKKTLPAESRLSADEIAQSIAGHISLHISSGKSVLLAEMVDRVEARQGFVNFFIKPHALSQAYSHIESAPAPPPARPPPPHPPPATPLQPKSPVKTLKLEIRDSSIFDQEEYELYVRYQESVHHEPRDTHSPEQYRNFLCESPLILDKSGPLQGYGSFHMRYLLETQDSTTTKQQQQLIGVSVLDVLPKGLSSVYFFYDPDLSESLRLGVFSVLKEIEILQKEASAQFSNYYMGFYIHTCTKMRYKGEYEPSELLCPVTMRWVPLSKCVKVLDRANFGAFSDEPPEKRSDDMSDTLVLAWQFICNLDQVVFKRHVNQQALMAQIRLYRDSVGDVLARRMLFFFAKRQNWVPSGGSVFQTVAASDRIIISD